MKQFTVCSAVVFAAMSFACTAAGETALYHGDLELVSISGANCGADMAAGKRLSVDLVVDVEPGHLEGYLSGTDMQLGHFTGSDPARLEIVFPDADNSSGHRLSLALGKDAAGGELHEKPLEATAKGCSFNAARLSLARNRDEVNAASLMRRKAARFLSDQKFYQGLEAYGAGRIAASVPDFQEAIRLLEQSQGEERQDLLEPSLYLSLAYCLLGRYEEGYRLQESAFTIPRDEVERKLVRTTTLVRLYNMQVERLVLEGKFEAALALLEHAVTRYPDLAGIQATRAVILVGLRRSVEACDHLETALKLQPRNEILKESLAWCLTQQAHEHYANEEVEASLPLYRRACDLNPKNVEAVRSLLSGYLATGQAVAAHAYLEEYQTAMANSLDPQQLRELKATFYRDEALLAEKGADYVRAEALLRQSMEVSADPAVPTTDLARILNKTGRFPEALLLLNDRRKQCGDDTCRKAIDTSLSKEAFLASLMRRLN